MRRVGRPSVKAPAHGKNGLRVEVTPEELAIIDRAATADGRTRGAWCRRTLVLAARKAEGK